MPVTYSMLLQQILDAVNMNDKSANSFLNENGLAISYPAFWSYRSFRSVPSFERAKAILKGFNYPIEDSDLEEILEYSRVELKNNILETKKYISKGVRLSPRQIAPSLSADELENVIMERARKVIGPDATINNYLNTLVKRDLIESGYIEEESE